MLTAAPVRCLWSNGWRLACADGVYLRIFAISSPHTSELNVNSPRIALVTVLLPCFCTPCIIMPKCDASVITATPRGDSI